MLGEKLIGYTNYKFILFDMETEGLNTLFNRPFQIAWLFGDKYKEWGFQNRFPLWEDLSPSRGAAAVTKFNMTDYLRVAEDRKKVFKDFIEVVMDEDYYLAGHNIIMFDSNLIVTFANQLGIKISFKDFQYRMIDTFALVRALRIGIPYRPKDDKHLFSWQMKVLNHPERPRGITLEALAKEFGFSENDDKFHDAEYDIQQNAKILRELIKRNKI